MSKINLVEMICGGGDSAFDQPCKYGHRVENHAVYCHNDKWADAPNDCTVTYDEAVCDGACLKEDCLIQIEIIDQAVKERKKEGEGETR